MKGIGVSPGIAHGKVFLFDELKPTIKETKVISIEDEIKRLERGLSESIDEIKILYESNKKIGKDIDILIAHMEILEDPELIDRIINMINNEEVNAEWAVSETINSFISIFEGLENDYMKDKIIDLRDVSSRLIRALSGHDLSELNNIEEESILVAKELTPSHVLSMDKNIRGIITELGGASSHTTIITRASGIPMVVGVEEIREFVGKGDYIILDGNNGEITINPNEEEINKCREVEDYRKIINLKLNKILSQDSITKDGCKVKLMGNIATPSDIDEVLESGGVGIGLFRTENLYLDRIPSEDQQFKLYKKALESLDGRPLIIRTLDIGGDKNIPHLKIEKEENPFLGSRGIRICLQNQDLFRLQLRAIYRASIYGDIRIMLPMISSIDEIRQVKIIIAEVKEQLKRESILFNDDVKLGIMVETPSVAIHSKAYAKEVDFFSIGTNDLIQYTFAIDRCNKDVAHLYDEFNPAILKLIKMTIDNGHEAGIEVGMCGEAANNPKLIPLFLAMDLDVFSMDASHILMSRYIINNTCKYEVSRDIDTILELSTGEEVERYLCKYMISI